MTAANKTAIDLAKGQHTSDRDEVLRTLKRALDSLEGTVDTVRKDIDDGKASWWADHTQGLVYSAGRVERLINQLVTWDRAVATLGQAEHYADQQ